MSFIAEFLEFLRARRKLWLIPLILVLSVCLGFVALAESAALAPFIYALF